MVTRTGRLYLRQWWAIFLLATAGCAPATENYWTGHEVTHNPLAPHSGEAVQITARVSSNVGKLQLEYQLVDPGHYIELADAAYRTKWQNLAMKPGAKVKSSLLFTAEMPAALQTNRRLVRYRFAAWDAEGHPLTLSATDDAIPNWAYFVYDGVPAWQGTINPRSGNPRLRTPVTFDTNSMRRVQSYFLLGKARSVENVTWREQSGGKEYKYTGTLVVDGVVYDHIHMRARGGVWRYAMGKNMWKFAFQKTRRLQAQDDYGIPYPVTWDKVNLRAPIQQADFGHRGEQGMFETVGFRLFNLAGVPAPYTHWIQLRIITGEEETPADQYRGDFWGLYLAIEDVDGHFLKTHELPDGNVYKMEGFSGTLSHHGAGAVTNRTDLEDFLASYNRSLKSEAWWRSQLNLPEYYSYRAICECIHHYDIGDGKNYYYYLNSRDHRWEVIPWDIDLTWANNMFGSGTEPFYRRVLGYPACQIEYQNRLREIRDLLFNPDETGRLIDEAAAIIADPAGAPSPVDADRMKWDYHPIMAMGFKAGQGLFYQISPTRDFRGMVELMKNYVKTRALWIDTYLLTDRKIPATPSLAYTGPPNYPLRQLTFHASEFHGPQPFAAIQWRLAEISPPALVQGRPVTPGKYEITPAWESGERTDSATEVTIPSASVTSGNTYRVRLRMKDTAGRWSHWSAPVEFLAGSHGQ